MIRIGLVALSLIAASFASAQDITSVASKAQSAYLSGNTAELTRLAATTSAWSKSQNTKELYTHAYVQFRILQLAIYAKRKSDAERAGDACNETLDLALKRDPKSAEAHALQSACYGYLANLGGMGAIRNGSRSGKSIEAALALDARNPRVVLIDGFGVYFRPKFVGGDKAKGCSRFKEAAASFDASGAAGAPSPAGVSWGAAESHYWTGRCASDAGDAAGARREFERALTLAPEFSAAAKALGR
jgi:Tfp pilus assembly protein PilF